ncbi:MAG: 16S rRNA (guanine(527)-N(7))-methyltransferase RsmG [Cyanobacteria bacterium P01_D01_bin.128]
MTESPTLPQNLDLWQETLGWQPSANQLGQFQRLYQTILTANQTVNLTRITEPKAFWEKHLWDSLSGVAPWLKSSASAQPTAEAPLHILDIGSGGGFPGIPVAIACPSWQITLLDSTQKKIRFVQYLAQQLGLENIAAIADRAENIGHQPHHRERYDLALIRAVGPAATCAEYALPVLKLGGQSVLYRGQWTAPEAAALEAAVDKLGGKIQTVRPWQTPISAGQRHCITLQKISSTPPDFPRAVGIPAKFPLCASM